MNRILKIRGIGIPVVVQRLTNPPGNHEVVGSIPGLAQEVKIWCCRGLWCRSQMWLGSDGAVAVVSASSCSSDLIPSLGTSTCRPGAALKSKKIYIYLSHFSRCGTGC